MARFFLNERSLHGQYQAPAELLAALRTVFGVRRVIKDGGFELEVSRRLAERPAVGVDDLRQALFATKQRDMTNAVLSWLDRHGPFWDNPQRHDPGEYFECGVDLVTESALAEAAMLLDLAEEVVVDLVSFTPSKYLDDPLLVLWRGLTAGDRQYEIQNHMGASTLAARLAVSAKPVRSWPEMLTTLRQHCPALFFSPDIPTQLDTCFYPNASRRCLVLLPALNAMVEAWRVGDTAKFEELRSLWMTGHRARFTDASDTEKNDAQFQRAMTFTDPRTRQAVFCGWHGKIQTPPYRIHFEWPPNDPKEPLFVAYIGPKLTKH